MKPLEGSLPLREIAGALLLLLNVGTGRFGKKKNSRRFGKFFCRNVRRHVFAETSCSPLGYVPISSSAPRLLGAAYIPILLSEVEQEQRPSGNGDREAIVVGAGLCDGEGKRAYIAYIMRDVSANFFSLRRFGIFFCRNVRRHVFAETSGIPKCHHQQG